MGGCEGLPLSEQAMIASVQLRWGGARPVAHGDVSQGVCTGEEQEVGYHYIRSALYFYQHQTNVGPRSSVKTVRCRDLPKDTAQWAED